MAEYRRFVAYVYEYVNGRKSKNAGFAKVEIRNGICRIQVHIPGIGAIDGKIEIFGFVREAENLPAVMLDESITNQMGLNRRITTPEETVGGSKYSFGQLSGIWIKSENGRNWATVFDDEPINMERLAEESKAAEAVEESEIVEAESEATAESEIVEAESEAVAESEIVEAESEVAAESEVVAAESEVVETEAESVTELKVVEAAEELMKLVEAAEESETSEEIVAEAAGERRMHDGLKQDRKWQCITAKYPHFQPVADESLEDAIRIQPSDLRMLWQKGWKQGNNSFLMHGYYQYHYLMLGKCRDGGYVLGVPGTRREQEEYMAKMFGFPEFKPALVQHGEIDFGYWCRPMN